MGANLLAQNPVFHSKTKHIDIDTHFIREKVAAGIVEPRYVPTDLQIADVLTKSLPADKFRFFCSKLNLVSSPQFSLRGDVGMMSEAQCTSVTQRQVTPQLYTGLAVYTTNEEVQDQRRNVSRLNRKEISLGS